MPRVGLPRRARRGAVALVAVAVALCAAMIWRPRDSVDPSSVPHANVPPRLVNVNAAGADEMSLLPGIGPAIAARIVADRAERGPFASVDELRRVKGIGAATLERVRPFATAGQPA